MKHLEHVAALLFADDARAKSDKILASLLAEAEARGGAVLAVREGRLRLFTGQDVPVEHLVRIEKTWASHSRALQRGAASKAGELVLAPLLEDGDLKGVIVLDSPRHFDLRDTELLRGLLARALGAPPSAPGPRLDVARLLAGEETIPGHELERRRLVDMLQRHEWNVALVARHLGVTRRTVYMRMERYGIERQRVPKTLKRSPVLP